MLSIIAACGLVLSACTAGGRPNPAPAPPAGTSGEGAARPEAACSVSRPSPYRPLPSSPAIRFVNGEYIPGNSNGYGNADLWAGLPVNGDLVTQRSSEGYVGMMGWWQVHPGKLTIGATALGGPSGGFAAEVRNTAYSGRTGFRLSRLMFPARGCWRITGRMRGREPLVFTVHVADARPAHPRPAPQGSGSDDEWHVDVS